jgi:hypothetical protein
MAARGERRAPQVRHRPVVKRIVVADERPAYRMECACGAAGEVHPSRRMAELDRHAHVAELVRQVPEGERCQMAREHRVQPWERCGLCAGQVALFEIGGRA